jgi:hypothetical protein
MKCPYCQFPEIYENYLLNRLSPEEKKDFELHLPDCKACQQELELTRILITGIRETGKQEMKAEIRRQVRERRAQPSVPDWGIYLKIAAVILFLVITPGMIYYYWQVLPEQQTVLPQAPREQILTEQLNELAKQPPADKDEEKTRIGLEVTAAKKGKSKELPPVVQEQKSTGTKTEKEDKLVPPAPITSLPARTEQELPVADMVMPASEEVGAVSRGSIEISAREQEERKKLLAPAAIFTFDSSQIHFQKNAQEMFLSKGKLESVPEVWQFRQNAQTLQISLQGSDQKFRQSGTSKLPDRFPVQIIQGNYPNLQMIWQLDTSLVKIDPRQIQILVDPSNNLIVQLPSGRQYQIDTRHDSTEAVMIKP